MQEQKKDYRTIAIKAMKVACAVLAVVAMFFVLNALKSVDWELAKAFWDYMNAPYGTTPPMVGDHYASSNDLYRVLNIPVLADGALKALYCLVPTPVLYTIATLMEKKK